MMSGNGQKPGGREVQLPARCGFIYAHPDDETFLSGALIRRLADEGGEPVLLLATRGDAGRKNGDYAHLSNEELGALREREMERAASVLGLAAVEQLGYPDGRLKEADEREAVEAIVRFVNKHRLEAVFTFPEDGGNGHPDHVAISRLATVAVRTGRCPTVRALYYAAPDASSAPIRIDAQPYWPVKAEALRAHESQKYAIARYFGPLDACPPNRRFECFVPAWEADRFIDKTETLI